MGKQFESKVALVTGGNSGLGRAIALAFAAQGAKVVVAARRVTEGEETVTMINDLGGEATFCKTDVSRGAQVKAMVNTCISKYGALDYAVNNAGILGTECTPVADYDEQVWDRVIEANLKAVWLCMKHQIPAMLERASGSIVNMSSVAGFR